MTLVKIFLVIPFSIIATARLEQLSVAKAAAANGVDGLHEAHFMDIFSVFRSARRRLVVAGFVLALTATTIANHTLMWGGW